MHGEVTRAVSLTKMQLRSARAVALIRALEAAASGQLRTRESDAGTFSRAIEGRMMDLGWTLPNIRMTVERDISRLREV